MRALATVVTLLFLAGICVAQEPDVDETADSIALESSEQAQPSSSALATINRILDVFPGFQQQQVRYQLGANLKAVVSQRLLPRMDGTGRIVACEVMRQTATVTNYIEEQKKTDSIKDIIAAGRSEYGMQTFDQHLTELYKTDIITLETAVSASTSPSDFQRALEVF